MGYNSVADIISLSSFV